MNKITIQKLDRFIELESYQNFLKEKEELQKKYPSKPWDLHNLGQGNYKNPFEQEWWDDWQSYKKELLDLMFSPNSNFQQFMWDIKDEGAEIKAQRAINGIKRSIHYAG